MTVERAGPTSTMRAKNKTKATAVQTTANVATAPTVSSETEAGR